MKKLLLAVGLIVAAPATAQTYAATFTGVTYSGVNGGNFFGTGAFLGPTPVTFRVTYTFDPASPGAAAIENISIFNAANTLSFAPRDVNSAVALASGTLPGGYGFTGDTILNFPGTGFIQTRDSANLLVRGPGFNGRFDQVGTFAVSGYSGTIFSIDYPTNGGPSSRFLTGGFGGSGNATIALVAAVTPPVPEPASWGMMILGFGVAGLAMRRQYRLTRRKGDRGASALLSAALVMAAPSSPADLVRPQERV